MPMDLRLHHELLLLALHDQKGTHAFGSMLNLGMGGGVFTELLLENRVEVVPGKKKGKELVEVRDASRTWDSVMDLALEKLSGAKRRASPSNTVSAIGSLKDLRHVAARDLCRKGILRETEDRVLLLFRRRVYPTIEPGPERALIERVRAVLRGERAPDERTVFLISLAEVTGLLPAIFDKAEVKALKPKIKPLVEAGVGSRAAREAVEAAHAAVMAATTASMVAATAAASS